MTANVRDEIAARRQARVAALGHAEGAVLPRRREVPVTPFPGANGLICEVKRRSPSRGGIAPGLDAAAQAGLYLRAGAGGLSILTEPEGFGGSLEDLIRVKKAHPGAAVLRKDFLFDEEDIDVSWRAGADAVLLIAGLLDGERLRGLHRRARELGMEALVEAHDAGDLRRAAAFAPGLVGINSRNLADFSLDPLLPVRIKAGIDWDAKVIYESGVSHPDQARFAADAGFHGILVGEAAVRDPGLAGRLLDALRRSRPARFWPEIGKRLFAGGGRPLVKICGLTREEDARAAAELGADVLGFVFWPASPRRAGPALLRSLRDIDIPKAAVTVSPAGAGALPPEVEALLEEGCLDAAQLHGGERPEDCAGLWPTHYKALRPADPGQAAAAGAYHCPRILLDAAAPAPGGTGQCVSEAVLDAWKRPLWLAGGVTPENAGRLAEARRPELLDVASGVEEAPGVKSPAKMRELFRELERFRS